MSIGAASRAGVFGLLSASLVAGVAPGRVTAQERPAAATFTARLNGEGQFRYLLDHRGGGAGTESGFQLTRARLVVSGTFLTPRLTYRLRPTYDRAAGTLSFDDAWMAYQLSDAWNLRIGQFRPWLQREDVVDAFAQMLLEPSWNNEYFTMKFTQAAQLTYDGGWWRPVVAIHDGSYGSNTDYNADRTEYAVSGRIEVRLGGGWAQFNGLSGWSGVRPAVLIGAGADYERGQSRTGRHTPNVLKYTADVTFNASRASFLAALNAQHFDNPADTAGGLPSHLDGASQWGLVLQAGVFAIPDALELYARYERTVFDGVYYRNNGANVQTGTRNYAGAPLRVITAGVSRAFRKDAAKWTAEAVWALDGVPVANTAAGQLDSGLGRQVTLRTQFQFRF